MGRIPIESFTASTVVVDGRELVAFGGCNYLGLAHHPRVHAAVHRAMTTLGLTTSASRETTGNTLEHEALEAELAEFFGMQAAILTPEGYTANIALAQALGHADAGDPAVAIIDARSHRSVRNAVEFAGMSVVDYPHLDGPGAADAIRQVASSGRRIVVWTDGVFAADGEIAPLADIYRALPQHNAALVVDDCHGFCVLGPAGRGTLEHFGIPLSDPRIAITTTLAKGLGCYGGAVIATQSLIEHVRRNAWIYKGTTPVPPILAHAAREALRVIREQPTLLADLARNIRAVRAGLIKAGLPVGDTASPVLTFVLRPEDRMDEAYQRLLDAGVLVPLIDYPNGPAPRYFRLSIGAAHTPEQTALVVDAVAEAVRLQPVAVS